MTLHSRLRVRAALSGLFLLFAVSSQSLPAAAQGTRSWEQSKFEDLTKGNATGVAIRSAGGLELAPSFKLLYATPSTYIWAVAADDSGNVYAATGSPARVYRITPDGKSSIIFQPQELQVQALRVGPGGVIYAATAPDGKVYKIEHKAGNSEKRPEEKSTESPQKDSKPALDASWSSTEYFSPGTKYIWDLALDKGGNLYIATGDHGEIFEVTPKGEHSVFFKSDETHIRALAVDAQGNLIAGTDGSGLVYRISPAGEGFVLYSAPKKEITALALDHDGNIYAAGVGEKRAGSGIASAASMLMSIQSNPTTAPPAGGVTMTPAPTAVPIGSFPVSRTPVEGLMFTASQRMARRPAYGRRTTIWCTRWLSIRKTDCWPALGTAGMFLPLAAPTTSRTC